MVVLTDLRWVVVVAIAALAGSLCSERSLADVTYPQRPAAGDVIADEAGLLTSTDADRIREIAQGLLEKDGIAIAVATITSMADHGASGWHIERYAHNLFDEWGVGSAANNRGVLLLVSKGDRKVRVEMGAAWNRDRDAAAAAVVSGVIVPAFKSGQFSRGIEQGVAGLAARLGSQHRLAGSSSAEPATGLPTGRAQTPAQAPTSTTSPSSGGVSSWLRGPAVLGPAACIVVGGAALFILIVVGRFGRSMRNYATTPLGGPAANATEGQMTTGSQVFGGFWPGFILGQMTGLRSSSNAGARGSSPGPSFFSGGGGFGGGGGSFGGGFSGGGGATGSW
ncbi:MAG: TPM domain-containing protein [Phycisphaeraceae bacterium]|nr:TPM domain-containing protein [Phycisphaeraceae bacterium]